MIINGNFKYQKFVTNTFHILNTDYTCEPTDMLPGQSYYQGRPIADYEVEDLNEADLLDSIKLHELT